LRILLNESHHSVQTLKKDPHYPLNLLLILLEEEFVEVLAFVGVEEDIRGGIDNVFSPLDQGILRGERSSLVECLSLFNGLGLALLALLASRNSGFGVVQGRVRLEANGFGRIDDIERRHEI